MKFVPAHAGEGRRAFPTWKAGPPPRSRSPEQLGNGENGPAARAPLPAATAGAEASPGEAEAPAPAPLGSGPTHLSDARGPAAGPAGAPPHPSHPRRPPLPGAAPPPGNSAAAGANSHWPLSVTPSRLLGVSRAAIGY